ncbi:hypothetical protein IQ231_15140 [Cuspidothrix issatschenkoi LEGE 03284]|uniref:hypothetical protein n=1 Tax=Cuspidothrix issatschenkoi TaxID=230752 RepID=UPI00187F9921|nr:hypothetical protein [Cuspidothrix issatschenkoi]MBE9232977.1 hypothetical protein [Cuspidothrix issatschenkoi LEGE 03284]
MENKEKILSATNGQWTTDHYLFKEQEALARAIACCVNGSYPNQLSPLPLSL